MDNTHGQTTSGVAGHHRPWTAHSWTTLGVACHDRLWAAHGRTTSSVACNHIRWMANMAEQRRAWHAIIAFEQHTQWNYVGRGMTSLPLESTHGRTTSGVTCHHHFWKAHSVKQHWAWYCHHRLMAAHTVQRRRAWHASIAFGQHKQSIDVRRCMKSPPLDCTHDRMTSGVA